MIGGNIDERWMRLALSLGTRNAGQTWPNPFVGCVIIKDTLVVGRGYTQQGGRPHAEAIALSQASNNAKGSTVYVTLEPCFHNSRNGSCTEQILRSGIKSISRLKAKTKTKT